jgi:cysteinyl-tRNA synthetase
MGDILGLFQGRERKLEDKTEELIQILIEVRNILRQEKKWTLADNIRERLQKLGIYLEDERDRTTWRLVSK